MKKLKISEQDYVHARWMLANQIDSPDDLIRVWRLLGAWKGMYPLIEKATPWYQDLQ